jgi:hypothetical protein
MGENLMLDIGMQTRPVAFYKEEEKLETMNEHGASSPSIEQIDERRDMIVDLFGDFFSRQK